ncbi:hypothetical protein ACHAPE_004538 [Trichoderma viride]
MRAGVAILLAGMASAADIQLSLNFADKTQSAPFFVPDQVEKVKIDSSKAVEGVVITPPFDHAFLRVRCEFFDPSGESLNNVELGEPAEDPIDPVAVLGFAQCNTL